MKFPHFFGVLAMVTFVVEDGTGKDDANTYSSVADVVEYAADRGVTITNEAATIAILQGMDYLETLSYAGYILEDEQALQLPRTNICSNTQTMNDYYYVTSRVYTAEQTVRIAKKALCELVIANQDGRIPDVVTEAITESVQVGPIKIAYGSSGNTATDGYTPSVIPKVDNIIAPLLDNRGNGIHTTLVTRYY